MDYDEPTIEEIKSRPYEEVEKFCPKCGTKYYDSDIFCFNCGNKVN